MHAKRSMHICTALHKFDTMYIILSPTHQCWGCKNSHLLYSLCAIRSGHHANKTDKHKFPTNIFSLLGYFEMSDNEEYVNSCSGYPAVK